MSSRVYRPTCTRYVLDVPEGTPGSRKVKEQQRPWYGRIVSDGGERFEPLAADKPRAKRMLAGLLGDGQRGELVKPAYTGFEKRVTKGTAAARKVREKSPIYWGAYIDPATGLEQRLSLKVTDQAAAKAKLHELVIKAERRTTSLADPFEDHFRRPLADHVADFRLTLQASNNTADHVALTISRIEAIFSGCHFRTLKDLDADVVATWLKGLREHGHVTPRATIAGTAKSYADIGNAFGVAERTVTYWRKEGAPIVARKENDLAAIARWLDSRARAAGGVSIETSNHYSGAVKQFGKWLFERGRVPKHPFASLKALNADVDRRHVRRLLSQPDFLQLLLATAQSDRCECGLNGVDRAMLYLTASQSGLRAKELATLTERSIDLDGEPPLLVVEAAYSKHRREDLQPIPRPMADRMKVWIADKHDGQPPERLRLVGSEPGDPQPLWRDWQYRRAAEMLRGDLLAAGIPYRDDAGRVFDFHSLRAQFISALEANGVSLKRAQELARHAKVETTSKNYTRIELADKAAAVASLPQPDAFDDRRQRATGTHDATPGNDAADSVVVAMVVRGVRQALQESASIGRDSRLQSAGQEMRNSRVERELTPVSAAKSSDEPSEADGTRTRNHRIDSHSLPVCKAFDGSDLEQAENPVAPMVVGDAESPIAAPSKPSISDLLKQVDLCEELPEADKQLLRRILSTAAT